MPPIKIGRLAALTALAMLAAACRGGEVPEVVTDEVSTGEVVQTIAAPATIQPRDQLTVTASVAGEVAEILVDDGARVTKDQPLVRLASDAVDLRVEQAEAALDATSAFAGVGAGLDLSPLFATVRTQYEAVIPDLLDGLAEQAGRIPDDDARAAALARIADARADYDATRRQLLAAETDASRQARNASAAQRAAAEGQRQQAEAALEAAEAQIDRLLIRAPRDGRVELARGGTGSTGDPAAGLGGLPDVAGLLGGGATTTDGPLAVGVTVGAGQPVATVYDLSSFHAAAEVDEIDAVELAEGQRASVFVDAFPDAELGGRVRHVAISPTRGDAGGVVYPVSVAVLTVPDGVDLRVGLTASVEIETRRVDDQAVVPAGALQRRDGREIVLAVADGTVRIVPVEVVAVGDGRAAVRGEIAVGDDVVVEGGADLDHGDPLP